MEKTSSNDTADSAANKEIIAGAVDNILSSSSSAAAAATAEEASATIVTMPSLEDSMIAAATTPPPPATTSAATVQDDDDDDDDDGTAVLGFLTPAPSTDEMDAPPSRVDPARKAQLMRAARTDRWNWIYACPLPYSMASSKKQQGETKEWWTRTHVATQYCPSIVPLVRQLRSGSTTDDDIPPHEDNPWLYPTGADILTRERQENGTSQQQKELLATYASLLQRLTDEPVLVATLRRLVQHQLPTYDTAAAVNRRLQHYLENEQQHDNDDEKRAFEAFVYGQCRDVIEKWLYTADAAAAEAAWQERLAALQFITAAHLEMDCFMTGDSDDKDELSNLLREPIAALQSVEAYHSPYDKLQAILTMYHGVNAALKQALNNNKTTKTTTEKLPSADDVLPTIILVLLRARPVRLLHNLTFCEEWSPAAYVRGEAGYAFTNLHGAVHFLQELNLDGNDVALNLSADDFRQGLAACRKRHEEQQQQEEKEQREQQEAKNKSSLENLALLEPVVIDPPVVSVQAVREARLQGEIIDLDWAASLQKPRDGAQQQSPVEESTNDNHMIQPLNAPKALRKSVWEEAAEGFPDDFQRDYRFLNASAADVSLAELPHLLHEYRSLVHCTELLYGERAKQLTKARRRQARATESDLWERVRHIDPSLVPIGKSMEK